MPKSFFSSAFSFPIFLLLVVTTAKSGALAYEPLAVPARFKPAILEYTISDETRQREIPIRVYLPSEKSPAPVVLFSHGLGGSREGSAFLGNHWAARGYVAVFLQHPGSDTSVWQSEAKSDRYSAMRKAANVQNFMLRVEDVPAVLDRLGGSKALRGRLDFQNVAMTGHSFGAVTTQAISGQKFPGVNSPLTDRRIKAAIAYSPSIPKRGDVREAFGEVKIPWLLMTGTNDKAVVSGADVKSRLAVFPALPPGDKYELVLNGAEHSIFTDGTLPGESKGHNPNHHRAILALSTAFLDAFLRGDASAKTWLDGDGPATVLEKEDRWQKK